MGSLSSKWSRPSHGQLARWRKWRACVVGQVKERLVNELWRRWSDRKVGEWALLCSFSNLSVTWPMALLILQPFFRFSYVKGSSLMSPGKSSMAYSLWGTTWDKIFKRDRKYTYPLSRTAAIMGWQHWCYPLLHICEKDSGGLLHCVVFTNVNLFPLFIYCGRHWQTQGFDWLSQTPPS